MTSATVCLIDRIRAAHHLGALHANASLEGVARSQVHTMLRQDYFADVRPTGQTPMTLIARSAYVRPNAELSVGQNIAWGSGAFDTPARIVAGWMASPPHRAIILTGVYRDTGVAIAPSLPRVLHAGSRGATYAMEFAVRR